MSARMARTTSEGDIARSQDLSAAKASERARALRAARTAALARRGAAAAEAEARAYLVCACGEDRYGLALEAAAAVLPMRHCTPVPGAVPALVGLAAISGRIVSVLDLARALGRRPGPRRDGEAGHLVLLRAGAAGPVALAVDRVLGLAHRSEPGAGPGTGAGDPGGMGDAAVSGYAPAGPESADDGGFVVLDLPRLLRRALP